MPPPRPPEHKLPRMKFTKKICEIFSEIFYTKDTCAEATILILENE